jgi:hypothetical protein
VPKKKSYQRDTRCIRVWGAPIFLLGDKNTTDRTAQRGPFGVFFFLRRLVPSTATSPTGGDLAAGHSPHCPHARPHPATPNPNLRPTRPPPPPTSTTAGGDHAASCFRPPPNPPPADLDPPLSPRRHSQDREEEDEMGGKVGLPTFLRKVYRICRGGGGVGPFEAGCGPFEAS